MSRVSTFLILALSSLSNSRWFVAVMYAGFAFFTNALFGVIGAAIEGTAFSWVSVFANIRQVGDVLFRLTPRFQTPPLYRRPSLWPSSLASAFVLEPPHPCRRGGDVTAGTPVVVNRAPVQVVRAGDRT